MYKVKVINGTDVGYYCGMFTVDGERLCGYEEDINHENVKVYKLQRTATKAMNDLITLYSGMSYKFEIVEA